MYPLLVEQRKPCYNKQQNISTCLKLQILSFDKEAGNNTLQLSKPAYTLPRTSSGSFRYPSLKNTITNVLQRNLPPVSSVPTDPCPFALPINVANALSS